MANRVDQNVRRAFKSHAASELQAVETLCCPLNILRGQVPPAANHKSTLMN